MCVLAALRTAAGAEFLGAVSESTTILAGVLSIIQPDLYDVGMAGLARLWAEPAFVPTPDVLREVLTLWSVPFNGVAVISNRSTPLHRDCNSWKEWMDLLVALGMYNQGILMVPGLGMEFLYNPGTVVGILGRVLQHGAECDGERACLAFYMRDKVHERLGLRVPTYYGL